ncbi:MAG: redoxin family protein [Planctomycetota bacterium]
MQDLSTTRSFKGFSGSRFVGIGLAAGLTLTATVGTAAGQSEAPSAARLEAQAKPNRQVDLLRGRSAEVVLAKYEHELLNDERAAVGSIAPRIAASHWLNGDPVKKFEPGKVYLVDFWATWCGPCIAAMPKLTSLQEEHKDDGLVVVAVNIFEKEDGDRRVDKVTRFVEDRDDMEYVVAIDAGATEKTWMDAERRNSIPTALLVDKTGRVAWVGNGHDPQMKTEVESLLREPGPGVDPLGAEDRAWLDTFVRVTSSGRVKESTEIGAALARERFADNPDALGSIASTITGLVRPMRIQRLLAEQTAERAVEVTNERDAAALATLARVKHMNMDTASAISLMERAIDIADDADQLADMKKTLAELRG